MHRPDPAGRFALDPKPAADLSAIDIDDPWAPPLDPLLNVNAIGSERETPRVRAALDRLGALLEGADMPSELHYGELPYRPGEPAWRAWWD